MNREKHDELNELGLDAKEHARMKQMLAEFRTESAKRAEQPEFFWQTQKTRILSNLREPERHKGLGWAATVAATTALVVFMAVPARHTVKTPTTAAKSNAAATQETNINDDVLLESVYETTNSSVPDALAPADILASEMDRGLEGASKKTGRNNE